MQPTHTYIHTGMAKKKLSYVRSRFCRRRMLVRLTNVFLFSLQHLFRSSRCTQTEADIFLLRARSLSLSFLFYFISSSLAAGEKFRLERRNARATALNGTRWNKKWRKRKSSREKGSELPPRPLLFKFCESARGDAYFRRTGKQSETKK